MIPAVFIIAFFGLYIYEMCCRISDFRNRRLDAAINYEMWDETDILSVDKALPGEVGVDIDLAL